MALGERCATRLEIFHGQDWLWNKAGEVSEQSRKCLFTMGGGLKFPTIPFGNCHVKEIQCTIIFF